MLSKSMSLIHTQWGLGRTGNCATLLGSGASTAHPGALLASAAAASAVRSSRDLMRVPGMEPRFSLWYGARVLHLREEPLYQSEGGRAKLHYLDEVSVAAESIVIRQ